MTSSYFCALNHLLSLHSDADSLMPDEQYALAELLCKAARQLFKIGLKYVEMQISMSIRFSTLLDHSRFRVVFHQGNASTVSKHASVVSLRCTLIQVHVLFCECGCGN